MQQLAIGMWLRASLVLASVAFVGCAPAKSPHEAAPRASLSAADKARDAERAISTPGSRATAGDDVIAALAGDGRFSRFAYELGRTRMAFLLHGPGPFVVFAPIDEAFRDVAEDDLAPFVETRAATTTLVKHHAILARGDERHALATGGVLRAMDAGTIRIARGGGAVSGCDVAGDVIRASNGIVVPIRCLLLPTGR